MGISKLSEKPDEVLGVTCDGLASHPGGVAILLVASCYGNREKLRLCGPLGSCANLTFTFFVDTKHDITVSILARLLLTRRLMLSQFKWLQPNTDRLDSMSINQMVFPISSF